MTRMIPLLERNEQFARTYTPAALGLPPHRCSSSLASTAEAAGLAEAALEASAVADPHTTVKADVEHLLTSSLLAPKVSVSGHVYDIATGRVTITLDARYP